MTLPYRVEALADHDRSQFDCGNDALNRYLKERAGQDQRRNLARCYLLIRQDDNRVVGYYTLSSASLPLVELPEKETKRLPRYQMVPAALLGRLAVDRTHSNQGLGKALLGHAIQKIQQADIASFVVLVDAKNAEVAVFYERHGFTRLVSSDGDQPRLFLTLKSANVLVADLLG